MIVNGNVWAGIYCALLALVTLDASAQDARWWLDRMNRAVEELNYEGTFVHVLGSNTERMLHDSNGSVLVARGWNVRQGGPA